MKYSYLAFVAMFFLNACESPKCEYLKITGFAQGTNYHITYENSKNKNYGDEIDALLKEFDQSCSLYNPKSIISRVNNNDSTVEADDWFIDVFKKSVEVSSSSGGALDITLGSITRAWGFGAAPVPKRDKAYIDSLLQYVGMDKVWMEGRKLMKKNRGVTLDMNGVAQGYSVDLVAKFLENKGIKNFLVEIGGEVRCKGTNAKNKLWRVGIDKPSDANMMLGGNLQAVVELNNLSMTTAGNYRKFFVENGVKYGHTIDPKTGFPAKNTLLSATVVCADAATADAWDTAFMVLGLEKSKALLEKLQGIEVYFIYSNEQGNYEIFMSEGFKKLIARDK